jgi:hypothetical protein
VCVPNCLNLVCSFLRFNQICSSSVHYSHTSVCQVVIGGNVKWVLVVLNCAANGTSGETVVSVDWSEINVLCVVFGKIGRFFSDR